MDGFVAAVEYVACIATVLATLRFSWWLLEMPYEGDRAALEELLEETAIW